MRQNAEMRKPFWESLLKVLSTRGWEVNILPCSVVINATVNCSPSFICDTLRNAVKNWRKTNGKQTKILLRKCDRDCMNWVCFIENLASQCVLYKQLMNQFSVHLPSPRGPGRSWALPAAHYCLQERTEGEHIQLQQSPPNLATHCFSLHELSLVNCCLEKRINNTDMVVNVTIINCSSLRMEQKAICINGGFH